MASISHHSAKQPVDLSRCDHPNSLVRSRACDDTARQAVLFRASVSSGRRQRLIASFPNGGASAVSRHRFAASICTLISDVAVP